MTFEIGNSLLSLENVVKVSRMGEKVALSSAAVSRVNASRKTVEKWVAEGRAVYGITTGFGPLCNMLVSTGNSSELQSNLIRSHSANVGPSFSREIVRATMLLRINSLAKGNSGIRLEVLNQYVQMLNRNVHPVIPQLGSVGASGDLCPLAHVALGAMGEGLAEFNGEVMDAGEALKKAGLKPMQYEAKEGLALINGTSNMTGIASLLVFDCRNLMKQFDIISAMTLENMLVSLSPFDEAAQLLKPHPGQIKTASNLRKLLKNSKLAVSNMELTKRLSNQFSKTADVAIADVSLQNAYSLRCTPQIMGSIRDALDYVESRVLTEANSVTDNPLVVGDEPFHGGHFHGISVSLPLDVLAIALAELAILSERRINRILDKDRSNGLPPFLIRKNPGLQMGFEGLQYTATNLTAESRILAGPASLQTISCNAENQDVVSMGLISARKALQIYNHVLNIAAIEWMCGLEASDIRGINKLGDASKQTYSLGRTVFSPLLKDRVMGPETEKMAELIRSNKLVQVVEEKIGKLE